MIKLDNGKKEALLLYRLLKETHGGVMKSPKAQSAKNKFKSQSSPLFEGNAKLGNKKKESAKNLSDNFAMPSLLGQTPPLAKSGARLIQRFAMVCCCCCRT